MAKTYKKIDDETIEITIVPDSIVEERDRAELQTELDHIPDRKEEIQEQLDIVDKRESELITMLKVFE
jgi:hypothetical protein